MKRTRLFYWLLTGLPALAEDVWGGSVPGAGHWLAQHDAFLP